MISGLKYAEVLEIYDTTPGSDDKKLHEIAYFFC